MTQVCLVIGAGAGIGGHVGARFAAGGYHSVLVRRSDADGLARLVSGICDAGGAATGRLVNAVEDGALEDLIAQVETDIGPIHTILYNLGAQIGDRPLEATSPKAFEMGWRLACFGLFRVAQAAFPAMAARGQGALLVTSATAALRGNKGQHSHAAAMGGRRMLCQSLNAQYASHGIHVAHIVVDGAVDAPDTLGKMLGPERFAAFRAAKGPDGLMNPAEMAESYWHIAHQHRAAWTHEMDLRAWSDVAWWNNA
ncbi:MAG: SDR family NAD(P)-dependent oxidoreductase [Pseudomonadota bacterium]